MQLLATMAKIDNLTRELAQLKSQHRGRSPNRNKQNRRSSSNSNDRSNSQRDATPSLHECRYHIRFGMGQHKNKRCFPNCKLHKEWLEARNNQKN